MTDKQKDKPTPTGLDLLRVTFPANQISKLPKPTKRQTDEVRADFKKGIRCQQCGQWHHPDVVHLDYVGHAALTDRLLDCDPNWNWEPTAWNEMGQPVMDANGGMWIKLTVCGVTRFGYGHPDGKKGGDAIKEVIGDALRNAAMRFGAALDLWHKGELHVSDDDEQKSEQPKFNVEEASKRIAFKLSSAQSLDDLAKFWKSEEATIKQIRAENADLFTELVAAKDAVKADLEKQNAIPDDEIPYGGETHGGSQ